MISNVCISLGSDLLMTAKVNHSTWLGFVDDLEGRHSTWLGFVDDIKVRIPLGSVL